MSKTEQKHQRMLQLIEDEARYTASLTGRKHFNETVMNAMASVPRDSFVDTDQLRYAYDNGPLPIGHGQTISQPYIVALMTDLLDLTPESIELPPRDLTSAYERPPLSDQTFVPEVY